LTFGRSDEELNKKMATKKTNGTTAHDDLRVSVDRVEYAALRDLQNLHEGCILERARVTNRNHDLATCCEAQAKRLIEVDLMLRHLENINGTQRVFIDLLRADHPRVAQLEDLSEFWRQWNVCTNKVVEREPQQRAAVAELEPHLFRSWSLWARDSGRLNRSFAVAGTRAGVEAQQTMSQDELQSHIIEQLRVKNASLAARNRELEGEIDAYKSSPKGKSAP
jgi:hypothetical protein